MALPDSFTPADRGVRFAEAAFWLEAHQLSDDATLQVALTTLGMFPEEGLSVPNLEQRNRLVKWVRQNPRASREQLLEWWDGELLQFAVESARLAEEQGQEPQTVTMNLATLEPNVAMRLVLEFQMRRNDPQRAREARVAAWNAIVLALQWISLQTRQSRSELLADWWERVRADLPLNCLQTFEMTTGGLKQCPIDFPDDVESDYPIDETPHTDISEEAGAFIREARPLLQHLGISGVRLMFARTEGAVTKTSVGDLCHYIDGTMPCPVLVLDANRIRLYMRRYHIGVKEVVWTTLAHECGHGWLDHQKVSFTFSDKVPLEAEEIAVEAMAQNWWKHRDPPEALRVLKETLMRESRKLTGT